MADIKEAISKVLKGVYSEKDLKKMGMVGGKPLSSYELGYDAQSNQLEPIYYWILDFVENMGFTVEKVTDNFMSSPGSGHFTQMQQKLQQAQQQISYHTSNVNNVAKSVLQLIYDLREFEIRLSNYKDANSKDVEKKAAALLALKQIWLDNVDIKKGVGAIHQMTSQGGFTTMRDVFMIANSLEDVEKMADDKGIINDQVKRVLKPRIAEFLKWKDFSEKELTKRFKIEKSYLKTQVETLKLYTRWARPYLKAAQQLEQKGNDKNPALINAFSTSTFELTLFAKKKDNALPDGMKDYHLKRDYDQCMVINFKYRGHLSRQVNERGDNAFMAQGKVDMAFDSYSLNSEEISFLDKELEKQDIADGLNFLEDSTEDVLKNLAEDIEKYTSDDFDKKLDEEKKEKTASEDINPFGALVSLFVPSKEKNKSKKKGKDEISEIKDIQKDNFVEKEVRKNVAKGAKGSLYTVYDIYKKAHRMASSPEPFDS